MKTYAEALPEIHAALCREAAEKSIVLLKNEGNILPLKKDAKISLVGSLAGNAGEVVGAWSMGWDKKDCVSILDGLKNAGASVAWYPCGGPEGELNESELKAACDNGDVIVAVVGELISMSGEASSKADITLPGCQRALLERLVASGKPLVTVLMNGRPLALGWEAEHLPVLLEAWHLGIQMGNAVASVLFGDVNPSGKLSSSFPYVNGQEPTYYNHPNTGRPASRSKFTSKYLDAPAKSLYPFGYGLSYTTFAYENFRAADMGDSLDIAVTVRNTGSRAGTETAQFYIRDVTASLVRPVKELKGYQRVTLAPGEAREVRLNLPKQDLGFYNNNGEYVLEDGLFRLYVGGDSENVQEQELTVRF